MPAGPAVHQIDERDHVGVALAPLKAGQQVAIGEAELVVRSDVPAGHKIALRPVAAGQPVCKFGHAIGRALHAIESGEHVHGHNLGPLPDTGMVDAPSRASRLPLTRAPGDGPAFLGYARENGQVGTRNEIWILCLNGAARTSAEQIALLSSEQIAPGIDGVFAFDAGDSSPLADEASARFLASLAAHPNAGGVLLVGLHRPDPEQIFAGGQKADPSRIRVLGLQEAGDEIGEGIRLVEELSQQAAKARRTPQPLAALVVGLKCGATDGLSGLTGNPLLGRVSDLLVSAGGTIILTELPEILAAEGYLAARAANAEVTAKLHAAADDYRAYFACQGLSAPDRPNPGNLAGGVTTLVEKAIGALQKAGHAPLTEMVSYGDRVAHGGFALLEAPGTDEISTAALAAAGGNLILFSTGRGTPLGSLVPTLKIASNTELAASKPHWIDFDAGPLLHDAAAAQVLQSLMSLITETASGKPCRAELNGSREVAFWKRGVFL